MTVTSLSKEEKALREFIESNLAFLETEVVLEREDNIFELGYVDSLFALQLVSFLEETFAAEITDEDLDISNFNSLAAMLGFLERKGATLP
jgi:acyl carrier protein